MTNPPSPACPECGNQLRRLPLVDGGGYLVSCSSCGYESVMHAQDDGHEPGAPDGKRRFHDLMNAAKSPPPTELPESLLEELPEQARRELQHTKPPQSAEPPPNSEQDSGGLSDIEKSLRQQGYYLYTDHTGSHLTGQGPKPGTGDLSALDVVRLAAELEGGIPAADDRGPCPHCQAVVSGRPERCPWCGKPMAGPQIE